MQTERKIEENILHTESYEWEMTITRCTQPRENKKELNSIASRTCLEEDMQNGNSEEKNNRNTLRYAE